MKFNFTIIKIVSLVTFLFETSIIQASPYALDFSENAYEKRALFERICKDHPSIKVYHNAMDEVKYSDLYRLRPGNIVVEHRNELGQFGPASMACGTAFGVFQQVILFPATLLGSPWIIKRHLKLKRIEKVSSILDELYMEHKGSSKLEGLLEFLQLSNPDSYEIQGLSLEGLKEVLIKLDEQGEFTRSTNGQRVDESEFLAFLTPRKILTFEELADLVYFTVTKKS